MSSHYTTEPPPTATVLLHTTAGPLTISLFAGQTPLTCRNFIQHCLDGYYENSIFHRVAPGFVIQTGDPTGTGDGGQNIYEDREFERLDTDWAKLLRTDEGEPINFDDEAHSRLKFNRRGLVGMAKGTGKGGGYGSQFFITLGDCRAELDGKCTMFGRVEGEGIYNVIKIAEGELLEGTERPMYPEKIQSVEVIELPKGEAWQKMRKRERVAARTQDFKEPAKKKPIKKKGAKALLSFGGEEEEDADGPQLTKPKKAKFNTALIDEESGTGKEAATTGTTISRTEKSKTSVSSAASLTPSAVAQSQKRKADPAPVRSPSPKRRKPSFHDSTTQLPLRDPESPSRSPSPASPPGQNDASRQSNSTNLAAEIAALKASMKRDTINTAPVTKKKSALESLIPATSMKGRRRPRPGETNSKDDARSMSVLDAFRARLEGANSETKSAREESIEKDMSMRSKSSSTSKNTKSNGNTDGSHSEDKNATENKPVNKTQNDDDDDDEEARLCDLHFIANCQSCFSNSTEDEADGNPNKDTNGINNDDNDTKFLSHSLTFEKDRLGKDLTWKKKNEEELVVIDPREREKELGIGDKNKSKHKNKERDGRGRDGKGRDREWDQGRDRDRDRNRAQGREEYRKR